MNVLLDVFIDLNLGDDVFLETLLNRYKNVNFYCFDNKKWEKEEMGYDKYKNLFFLPISFSLIKSDSFDAYIIMGGDMFPQNGDFVLRKFICKSFSDAKKPIYIIGCNLYKNYSEDIQKDILYIFSKSSYAAVRDACTYRFLKTRLKNNRIVYSGDIAFSNHNLEGITKNGNILGISVRRKNDLGEDEYRKYCAWFARLAEHYIKQNEDNKLRFFAFSNGITKDIVVIHDIYSQMVANPERVEIVDYCGNINETLRMYSECNHYITTRFHGLIFALGYQGKFIPFEYEEKCVNLLDDIEYSGIRINYDSLDQGSIAVVVNQLFSSEFFYDRDKLKDHILRSELNFSTMDLFLNQGNQENKVIHLEAEYQSNLSVLLNESMKKRIIVFGTGSLSLKLSSHYKYCIEYYVDNDESKWNGSFLDKSVRSPVTLSDENKDDIFILIASQYYTEISCQLEIMGFQSNKHYIDKEQYHLLASNL